MIEDAKNSTIMGGFGEDTITIEADDSEIDGGFGDDYLTIKESTNSTIRGNEGFDVITAKLSGGWIDGGDGLDTINVSIEPDAYVLISGGADEDEINVDASALPVFEGSAQFGVSGGTGFDEIEITVGAGPSDSSAWAGDNVTVLADGTIQVKVGSVDDFDPDEDSLTIVDNGG